MTDDDKRYNEKIREHSLVTTAAVGTELGRDFVEATIGGLGVVLLPRVIALALPVFGRAKSRQTQKWLERLLRERGDEPGEVKNAFYESVLNDPRAAAALIANYNTLLEAEDPAVVATLAALGAYYASHGGPTVFFRAYCRVLKEMSAHLFGILGTVLHALEQETNDLIVVRAVTTSRGSKLTRVDAPPSDPAVELLNLAADRQASGGRFGRVVEPITIAELDGVPSSDLRALFVLLGINGLTYAATAGMASAYDAPDLQTSGPDILRIERQIATEMLKFWREPTA